MFGLYFVLLLYVFCFAYIASACRVEMHLLFSFFVLRTMSLYLFVVSCFVVVVVASNEVIIFVVAYE